LKLQLKTAESEEEKEEIISLISNLKNSSPIKRKLVSKVVMDRLRLQLKTAESEEEREEIISLIRNLKVKKKKVSK